MWYVLRQKHTEQRKNGVKQQIISIIPAALGKVKKNTSGEENRETLVKVKHLAMKACGGTRWRQSFSSHLSNLTPPT
jgi:hypothetical protein